METLSQPLHPETRARVRRAVYSHAFEYFIVALILANALLLGLETVSTLNERYGVWLEAGQWAILGVFIAEAALKLFAVSPRIDRYFRDPWNDFDFLIIVASLVPAVGALATVARMARLLRVLRLVSVVPELRLLVATLLRSLPGMVHILILMSALMYVYGVIGYQLFHDHDPTHWHSLGISLLSLFRIITLEDWTDIMYAAMELHPTAWIFFASFVVLATFVVINLFTALIVNNLDVVRQTRREEDEGEDADRTRESLLRELRAARESLRRLEEQVERFAAERDRDPDR